MRGLVLKMLNVKYRRGFAVARMSAFAVSIAKTRNSAAYPIPVLPGHLNVRQVLKIGHGERNDRFVQQSGRRFG
jgi:hypothetical protein